MSNVFEDGFPLEEMSPQAHGLIMRAATHLSRAELHPEGGERSMNFADACARSAAEMLHSAARTGRQTMWLQIVRYAAELHAARLVAEAKNNL